MSAREELDRTLHDYLDGRLSDSKRGEFESRLARDPELAARVRAYRSIGRRMRETRIEPPPGLVRRARARFEQSRSRGSRSRPLTWQAIGVVAAGVLLAVLILPERVRETMPPPAPAKPEDARGDRSAAPPTATEPFERANRTGRADDADRSASGVRGEVAEAEEPSPPKQPRALDEVATDALPPAEVDAGAVAGEAGEPSRPAGRPGHAPPGRREVALRDRDPRRKAEKRVADAATPARLRAWPIPAGIVAPMATTVVGSPAEWRNLRIEESRPGEAVEPDFDSHRVVLVGPRPGLGDCEGIRGRPTASGFELILVAGAGPSATGGCAVLIPAGRTPVEIATEDPR